MITKAIHVITAAILTVSAIASAEEPAKQVSLGGLLSSDPIPAGFEVRGPDDIVESGKTIAQKLVLTKMGSISKVVVTIEHTERRTRGARAAAFKGYVNGTVQLLAATGLKLVRKNVPDARSADFSKRQTADLLYAQANGKALHVQLQIFFERYGYNIAVMGASENEHAVLSRWASSITL